LEVHRQKQTLHKKCHKNDQNWKQTKDKNHKHMKGIFWLPFGTFKILTVSDVW
jgi:hypothetical protein